MYFFRENITPKCFLSDFLIPSLGKSEGQRLITFLNYMCVIQIVFLTFLSFFSNDIICCWIFSSNTQELFYLNKMFDFLLSTSLCMCRKQTISLLCSRMTQEVRKLFVKFIDKSVSAQFFPKYCIMLFFLNSKIDV